MTKVIGIITTKNRFELLQKALQSVLIQTKPLDLTLVISDSNDEVYAQEKALLKSLGIQLIKNKNSKNYAGSLNTALIYLIKNKYLSNLENIESTYIALLDDDDYWDKEYIKKCFDEASAGVDFVVTGIHYMLKDETIQLSIPKTLSVDDFLAGNPHIQGSNTFINLKTFLKLGALDESMNSTIDRDMFVRCMLLNPKYKVINEHLVYANAYHQKNRITGDLTRKLQGLKQFYRKYQGLMSDSIKHQFFNRAKKMFQISESDFNYDNLCLDNTYQENIETQNEEQLLIGFIATDYEAARRLINQIISLNRTKLRVLIIVNGNYDYSAFKTLLNTEDIEHLLITLDEIKENHTLNNYGPFVSDYHIKDKVSFISLSRRILHYHLYRYSNENETIWIVDEDVNLNQEIVIDNKIVQVKTPIDYIVSKYKQKLDVGVGNITHDPAIPSLSTVRTNLIDYFYNQHKTQDFNRIISQSMHDYYYDFTDAHRTHLEQPFNIDKAVCLDDVFSGKAMGRKLVLLSDTIKEASSHGGNTLIFNKEVLKVPNLSLKIDNQYTRRGDYFWIQTCIQKGYKIKNLPFAVNHMRTKTPFNYKKALDKLKRDLFGSSLIKTYSEFKDLTSKAYRDKYIDILQTRLVKVIMSFYRIQGLLENLGDHRYIQYFNDEHIHGFINSVQRALAEDKLRSSFTQLARYLKIYERLVYETTEISLIETQFKTRNLRLLGYGSEANVYTDELFVYKVFHEPLDNKDLLNKSIFKHTSSLYELEIHDLDNLTIIRYPYEHSNEYDGGHVDEFIQFANDLKENNLVFTNVNARNFRINDKNELKLIDYGSAIKAWDKETYERMIERIFQLIRYNHISILEFKTIINLSYKRLSSNFNQGLDLFKEIVNRRTKEAIHDNLITDLIKNNKPNSLLDYGAGKCKIANHFVSKINHVSVFDIDYDVVTERAHHDAVIIRNIEVESRQFDLINSNLVLCAVTKEISDYITSQMSRLISDDGNVIISICNPFYNHIANTELRVESKINDYKNACTYKKRSRLYKTLRNEHHRPFSFYEKLLNKHGLYINDVHETNGVNMDNLNPIGEHLVLICSKKPQIVFRNAAEHALVIYIGETTTEHIRAQWQSLARESLNNTHVYVINESTNQLHEDYARLLFIKSRKFKDNVTLIQNNRKIGFVQSVEDVLSKYVTNKNYQYCTIHDINFTINGVNAIEDIKKQLDQNHSFIVHSVFDEDSPFDFESTENDDYLPISFRIDYCDKLSFNEITKMDNQIESDVKLYRKYKFS